MSVLGRPSRWSPLASALHYASQQLASLLAESRAGHEEARHKQVLKANDVQEYTSNPDASAEKILTRTAPAAAPCGFFPWRLSTTDFTLLGLSQRAESAALSTFHQTLTENVKVVTLMIAFGGAGGI